LNTKRRKEEGGQRLWYHDTEKNRKDPTKVHCTTVKEQPPIAAQETTSLENEEEAATE
jgi:hypothetical protein